MLLFSSVALEQKFWGEWGVKIDNIFGRRKCIYRYSVHIKKILKLKGKEKGGDGNVWTIKCSFLRQKSLSYVQHEDFTELYTGLIGVHPSYRDTVGEVVFM